MTRAASAAAFALLATLVACGSDDETTTTTGPDVTFASPGASDTAGTAGTTTGSPTPASDAATTAPAESGSVPEATATASSTVPATTEPLGDPRVGLTRVAEAASPVDLAWRTDDPTLFVVEQDGIVRALRDGALASAPLLDITDETDGSGEQGLLGLTFSADGTLAYVNFTDDDEGHTHIVEYAVSADGVFDEGSRRELLVIEQPYGNHNGGNVTIGPDGMLYIGMGDGGSGGDPERRALNVTTLLGKILRIDPTPADGAPYSIPPDNPFVDVDGARPEIWSVGVRNPWRMSFDRATGDLWFGDVGQGEWEEIDVARAADGAGRGFNFGWSAFEGTHRFNEDQPEDGAIPPIFEYEHGDAGCSISAGAVYRGAAIPALAGWYVHADYCSGKVFGLRVDGGTAAASLELAQADSVSAVREGPDGELYVLSTAGPIDLVTPA